MDFKKYLNQFYTSEKNTHSIFPCDKFKKGSKLKIPKDKLNEFYEKCHYYIFEKNDNIPILEKVQSKVPFFLDLDFKYEDELSERQYTKETINQLYIYLCNYLITFLEDKQDL